MELQVWDQNLAETVAEDYREEEMYFTSCEWERWMDAQYMEEETYAGLLEEDEPTEPDWDEIEDYGGFLEGASIEE